MLTNMVPARGEKAIKEMMRQQECAEKNKQRQLAHAKKVEEDQERKRMRLEEHEERKRRRLEEKSKEYEEEKRVKSEEDAKLIETAVNGMEKVASSYVGKVMVERMRILHDIRTESEKHWEDRCSELESQVDDLRGEKSVLKTERNTLRDLLSSSEARERTLRQNVEGFMKANVELTLKLTTLAQKNEELNSTMASNEKHCDRYEKEKTTAVQEKITAVHDLKATIVEKEVLQMKWKQAEQDGENKLRERVEMFNNSFSNLLQGIH